MRIAYGTLVLALLSTGAFGADIYRSTAPDGTVSYSDRPQDADAEFVSATPGSAQRPSASPAQTRRAAATTAAAAPRAPGNPLVPGGPSSRELREERQKNCDIARERQERYTLSRRLFQTNAAGEREYLDDAAIAEARAKAAQDVQDWCD